MYERRRDPLVPRRVFVRRVLNHFGLGSLILSGSLLLGILGYHYLAGLSWLDALLDASMILSGEGPVNELRTTEGKLFASFYALFSGVAFITTMGVVFAPVVHRLLHKFHIKETS